MSIYTKVLRLAFACATLYGASAALAAPIAVSVVTPSSTFFTYNVANLINGNGMVGALHTGDYNGKWMTNQTTTGELTFDLGVFNFVTDTTIWNYGPGCCDAGRSVKDLGISYSSDNLSYTSLLDVVLTNPASDPFAGQQVNLNVGARYIKFALNSNYGSGFIGLSEVKFAGAPAAVPEPATGALLGLGLLGLLAARRRSAKNKNA